MNEDFIQFIWRYLIFDKQQLLTVDKEEIQILKQGTLNTNAGPDFENALIKIGKTKWAGAVEIHVNASDWLKHKHSLNKSYDKVILHVVYNADAVILNTHGAIIPCLELKGRIPLKVFNRYQSINLSADKIPCNGLINEVDEFIITLWKERLLIERFEYKTDDINKRLLDNNNDWDDCFFQLLCKSLGLKINSEAFENLAKRLPKSTLNKHIDDLPAIEAMLFGVAGFLNGEINDDYYEKLVHEFKHYKAKFALNPLQVEQWKFMRLRPASFPTIRIAQLAAILLKNQNLFSTIVNAKKLKDVVDTLKVKASPYWDNHYRFGNISKEEKVKFLGDSAINIILINAVCPLLFVYGKVYKKPFLVEKSINWMQQITAEKNTIIKNWNVLNIVAENAAQSQALIHLSKEYCSKKQCLKCQIGLKILS